MGVTGGGEIYILPPLIIENSLKKKMVSLIVTYNYQKKIINGNGNRAMQMFSYVFKL